MVSVMLGPTLDTPRLVLRPPTADDLEAWIALMGDAEATRYLGGPKPRSVAWRSSLPTSAHGLCVGLATSRSLRRTRAIGSVTLGPGNPRAGLDQRSAGHWLVRHGERVTLRRRREPASIGCSTISGGKRSSISSTRRTILRSPWQSGWDLEGSAQPCSQRRSRHPPLRLTARAACIALKGCFPPRLCENA